MDIDTSSIKPLGPRLDQLKQKLLLDMPPRVKQRVLEYITSLGNSDLLTSAIKKGDRAPDFTLKDIQGEDVSLYSELEKGPVALCYYRGEWCHFCMEELVALQEVYQQIRKLGAQLLSVSPQNEAHTTSTAQKLGFTYPVLRDPDSKLSDLYGLTITVDEPMRKVYEEIGIHIEEHNDNFSYKLPVPAAYVIDQNGMIVYDYLEADYTKRVEPAELLNKLREIT
ncbi:MAG: AhpC/TSA family protein [Nitrospinota bacterium]|nr:AhpC/TSA family protein [Nitrospinota bacterium]